jgi:hypothetical protein
VAQTTPRFFAFGNVFENDLIEVGLLAPDQVIGRCVGEEILSDTEWLSIERSYGRELPPVVRHRIGYSIHSFRFWADGECNLDLVSRLKADVVEIKERAASNYLLSVTTTIVEQCEELLSNLDDREKQIWPGQLWQTWVCYIKAVLNEFDLPVEIRHDEDAGKRPSPIVQLIWELQQFIPASHRKGAASKTALAMGIRRAWRYTIPPKK